MKIEQKEMKIEGAIFDFDGTLLDSMSIWETIGEDYLKSIGKKPETGLKTKLETMSLEQAANYFISEYGVTGSTKEIIKSINEMISEFYFESAYAKKGVKEFLEELKLKNIKMCIATASDRFLVEKSLENNEILGYFEDIITCNEEGVGKDNVAIFNKALQVLGTNRKRTYVFEDALFAIKTAKKAGLPVVAVFDESAAKQQEEIKQIADIYIESFLEMGGYFD